MHIEYEVFTSGGETGLGTAETAQPRALVRWTERGRVRDIKNEITRNRLQHLVFIDRNFFADHATAIAMCREMRVRDINVLWEAHMDGTPSRELLQEMRLAGCQRVIIHIGPNEAGEALALAREFGFDIAMRNTDGTPYATERTNYTVAEREEIADRLPGLHSVQFDLAVAYYRAGRYHEVMQPLGKAMTLRFPMNELCLNLLACLGAAKHYPDMAAGLLDQAAHGCPHPVVFRNRELLKSWLESGGDVKGVRLVLEPDNTPVAYA